MPAQTHYRRPEIAPVPAMLGTELGLAVNRTRSKAVSGCDEHPTTAEEREVCSRSFAHFLRHWWFKNRDTGIVRRFDTLWPGQQRCVEQMELYPWLILLKAGKLGFSELECAFDGWKLIFRGANTRVHIFSMDKGSAQQFLNVVRFGISHLPAWLGLPILSKAPGGDTTQSLKLYGGPDDERIAVSYPATKDAAIDAVAHHSHVDELARMPWPEDTWSSIQSTVAPGGTVHIVSRGAGDGNFMTTLWYQAEGGESALHPHFEPFQSRPRTPVREVPPGADPNEVWYEEQAASMPSHQLNYLAPRVAEDALKGTGEGAYMAESIWMGCADTSMPPLLPGDPIPLVMALDAGVNNDLFAAVLVSRHPDHAVLDEHGNPGPPCHRTGDDPAIRAVKVWAPPPNGGEIDYAEPENWIRMICWGGCYMGHPNDPARLSSGKMCSEHPSERWRHGGCYAPEGEDCESCRRGERFAKHNVVQITYDAYQLVNMTQDLSRDRIAWCYKFGQGGDRLEADADLRLRCVQRSLAHPNDATLNAHVRNANAKVAPGEDTKMRIVKRSPNGKIDAIVAASMGVRQCLYLDLRPLRSTR